MKKRGQAPDAYTYTILLRGFAKNASQGRAYTVESALKVYHSMYNENSKVKPSIIHTNAMLSVCSRANDLDAVFSVAARLPERGSDAPDSHSYTTILQALRADAIKPLRMDSKEGTKQRRQRNIMQGRRIWADIVQRWRNSSISVDEQLVCSMARLLLTGKTTRDVDDVLSLVEQTMRLPRPIPRFGDLERPTHLQVGDNEHQEVVKLAGALDVQASGPPDASIDWVVEDQQKVFEPVIDKDRAAEKHEFSPLPPSVHSIPYPTPGNNTLSLLLNACTQMHAYAQAQHYWDTITQTIKPDRDNYHDYLRLLRLRRSSSLAVDLVEDMVRSEEKGGLGVRPDQTTFRTAIGACIRNGMSMLVLKSGIRLVNLMRSTLYEPDYDTTVLFMGLLSKSDMRWPVQDVIAATDLLFDLFCSLRGLWAFGRTEPEPKLDDQGSDSALREEAVEALDPVSLDLLPTYDKEMLSPELLERGHIRMQERSTLKQLGQQLEAGLSRTLQLYGTDLSQLEQKKILEYRARVRDWIFRKRRRAPEGMQWRGVQSVRDTIRSGRSTRRGQEHAGSMEAQDMHLPQRGQIWTPDTT